jgi:hypothetical protein
MEYEDEVINYDDELFIWKGRAIQLETEYNELMKQYEQVKTLKEQLELHILQNEQPKTSKKKRNMSQYQQEFKAFLEKKKNDPDFIALIRGKLETLELVTQNEPIPWVILRNECKKLFKNNSKEHQNIS